MSAAYALDLDDFAPYPRRATGMNVIHLHGALAEKFGPVHEYVVNSPREAIRALCCNKPGFGDAIAPMELKIVRIKRGPGMPFELDETELRMRMSHDTDLHIMPVPAGSKKGGVGKVILGIVVIAATIFTAGAAAPAGTALFGAGGALAATTALGISYGTIALFGLSMALGGLAMMMAPSPKAANPNDLEDKKQSFLFNGVVNVQEQGHPEPLVYGRFRVGSVVISSSLVDEQVMVGGGGGSFEGGGYEGWPGGGGGIGGGLDNGFNDWLWEFNMSRWEPQVPIVGPVGI